MYVLCKKLRDVAAGDWVPPSLTRQPCAGCGTTVLVSPSSQTLLSQGMKLVCPDCLPTDTPVVPAMTAAQLAEKQQYDQAFHRRN